MSDVPTRRLLIALSGGIDSVVLLDRMVARVAKDEAVRYKLIVAHFDHGIRPDSAADERFCRGLAEQYGLDYVSAREELGTNASEDTARRCRYAFLRAQAEKLNAELVTAHHYDDIIESIAINISRGTGWRGLTPMSADDIFRPLLKISKESIRRYALEHRLEWVEDETNQTTLYLRNQFRFAINTLPSEYIWALGTLYRRQRQLRQEIMLESESFLDYCTDRYFLIMIPEKVAMELMRLFLEREGVAATRPQLRRILHICKCAAEGTMHDISKSHTLSVTKKQIIVTRTE